MSAAAPKRDSNQVAGTPPEKRARFPRTARLLRHADFERVYKLGRRHFSASMTFFYLRPEAKPEGQPAEGQGQRQRAAKRGPETSAFRVGFTVGRALGGAVERNRMKRRLREAVRLTRSVVGVAADVVINPKKSLLTADFSDVVSEVSKAIAVIEERLAGKQGVP